ncbi:MAG: MFS transporter [Clostridiales bacterium]|nr:MFS transporter [Clostridiales bacterium]
MDNAKTNKTDTRIRIAILSLCFIVVVYLVPAVAMNGILAAFPGVSENTVMLMLSLPNLTGLAGILIVPAVQKWLTYKAQSLLAMGLLLVSGTLSLALADSLPLLITMAGLLGFAYGVLATTYPLLVGLHFSGTARAFMMGVAAGVLQLGRLVIALLAGFLADIRWNYIYFTFVFVAAAFVIVLLLLPNARALPPVKTEKKRAPLWKNGELVRLCLLGLLFTVLYYLTVTHISLYVEGGGLGTAATTGMANGVGLVAGVAMSFLFSKLFRFTGKATLAVAFGLLGLGYLCCGFFVNLPALLVGLIFANLGMGLAAPYFMLRGGLVAPGAEGPAMAVLLVFINFGYFCSPYISTLLSGGAPLAFLYFGLVAGVVGAILAASRIAQGISKKE